jgi:hypothetical protein
LTLDTGKGFTAGYDGSDPNPTKFTYLSTEHNADLIVSFGKLAKLTGEDKYKKASDSAKAFVLSMYDPKRGLFYTGTGADGVTISKEVIPLDCQTWTLLALHNDPNEKVDFYEKVIDYTKEHMGVEGGFDFDADSHDGVWYEGTLQMGILYHAYGKTQDAEKILEYVDSKRLPDGSVTAADRDGLSTGFYLSSTDKPISWEYFKRQHLGATAWLAFLQEGFKNPLSY